MGLVNPVILCGPELVLNLTTVDKEHFWNTSFTDSQKNTLDLSLKFTTQPQYYREPQRLRPEKASMWRKQAQEKHPRTTTTCLLALPGSRGFDIIPITQGVLPHIQKAEVSPDFILI